MFSPKKCVNLRVLDLELVSFIRKLLFTSVTLSFPPFFGEKINPVTQTTYEPPALASPLLSLCVVSNLTDYSNSLVTYLNLVKYHHAFLQFIGVAYICL